MRTLLLHEVKTVELMLANKPDVGCPLPTYVERVVTSNDTAFKAPFVVNRSFTTYFHNNERNSGSDVELVDCQLCMPETIGHEAFLTRETATNRLAFLEFCSSPIGDRTTVLSALQAVCNWPFIEQEFTHCLGLFAGLNTLFPNAREIPTNSELHLAELRMLVFGSIVCFCFSTASMAMTDEPAELTARHSGPDGTVQCVRWDNETMLEGWLDCSLAAG